MKKFVAVGWIFLFSKLYGEYVTPAIINKQGEIELYGFIKGYTQEWDKGKGIFQHREGCLQYGIKYTPIYNLEIFLNPPLGRYHRGLGEIAYTQIGDMDLGMKLIFTPTRETHPEYRTHFGIFTFLRIPTGAWDIPIHDDWCPKFSNKKFGGGAKLIFTQNTGIGDLHFNIGVLRNIGDVVSPDNPISPNRVPIGIGTTLYNGIFLGVTTDINKYNDKIPVTKNPKWINFGINYKYSESVRLVIGGEIGTWGTGDPPLNPWFKGYEQTQYPWVASVGIIYFPKRVRPEVKPETLIVTQTITTPETVKVIETKIETVTVVETVVEKVPYRFKVQIGAFKIKENAYRLYTSLKDIYKHLIYIEEIPPYWKVRIGNYSTRKEAIEMRKKLIKEGFSDAFIAID